MESLTLDAERVRQAISMPGLIAALREALLAGARGEFVTPQRHSFSQGAGLVMTSHHALSGTTVTKCLSSSRMRTPSLAGCVVWTSSRAPVTVVADAAAVTSLRTGAIVGVATDLLASPESETLLMYGTGAQAADQIRAVCAVRNIRNVWIVGRDEKRARALCESLSQEYADVDLQHTTQPAAYLERADIVSCATSTEVPLFTGRQLRPNAHVNGIGSFLPRMRELPEDLLATATAVVVDDVEACLAEAGEIIDAINQTSLRKSELLPLGALLTRGRQSRAGRTVFKSVGIAIQDWAVMDRLAEIYLAEKGIHP